MNFNIKNTILVFLLLYSLPVFCLAQNSAYSKAESQNVNLVFHYNLLETVNELDAAASLDVWSKKWLEEWNKKNNIKYLVSVHITKNISQIERLLNSGEITLLAVSSIDYLRFKDILKIEPLFVSGSHDSNFDQFFIIANPKSQIENLSNIKNKKLIIPPGVLSQISNIWLSGLTHKQFGESVENIFSKIDVSNSAIQTVLQVYFNKYDICVIDKNSFDIICDMNPNISKELIILEKSDKFPHSVMMLFNTNDSHIKKFVKENALGLENDDYGRQLLKLFKVQKIIPYKKEYMIGINKLFKSNQEMQSNSKN